jgi:hypothetical protein
LVGHQRSAHEHDKEEIKMVKVFIAQGYDSYNNKQKTRAFLAPSDADNYLEGLTDPRIHVFMAKSYINLLNEFLKG